MMKEQLIQLLEETSLKHISSKVKKLGLILELEELTSYLPDSSLTIQRIWHIINDVNTVRECTCRKPLKFLGFSRGYSLGCGNTCPDLNDSKRIKVKQYQQSLSLESKLEIDQKKKATYALKNNGATHWSQVPDKLEQFKTTFAKNRSDGKHKKVEPPFNRKDVLIKSNETFKLNNPGYQNPFQLPKVRKARKETGYNTLQIEKANETRFSHFYDKYVTELAESGLELLCSKDSFQGVYFQTYKFRHNCGNVFESTTYGGQRNFPTCRKCEPINTYKSKGESEVFAFIKTMCDDAYQSDRDIIAPQELDIVIPSKNIAIEYCGLLWHSESFGNKDKFYHFNKMKKCEEAGFRLITIFEDEWQCRQSIVKRVLQNMLGHSKRIGARDCKISRVALDEAREFTNLYHLQGHSNAKVYYGAYYKDELVSVMSFSKNRKITGSKDYCYEIVRFCSSLNIVGVANKLFSSFIKDFAPKKVISYCDLRWFTGGVYIQLGMKQSNIPGPGYWYTKDYANRMHRYNFTKHRLVNLHQQDDSLTESQIMKNLGYDKIWDCGQAKFEIEF